MRCLVPWQRLKQVLGAGHHERHDQPVRLRQGQRTFSRLVRRPLITELAIGDHGKHLSLDDGDVTDNRSGAVQDVLHGIQRSSRLAFRKEDHRAGITDFARAGAILGIPATGRDIHWDGVDIYQLQGGKIRAIWAGDDWSAILFYTGTYKAPWIH